MKKSLLFFLLPLLFLAGCSSEGDGTITITAPSGKKVVTECPSGDKTSDSLCREARKLVLQGGQGPSFLVGCSPNLKTYSIRGSLVVDGKKRGVYAIWDCNTMNMVQDLYDATKARAEQVLGPAAGQPDY